MYRIDFYKDGTYIAYMENGSTDKGTYKLVDGVLVLTNDHQEKFMFKLDKGVYILNYSGYLFEIGHHDYNKLKKAVK